MTEKPPKHQPKHDHAPAHMRKKIKVKLPPIVFAVKPSCGVLEPGETKNVWIRFTPTEEVRTVSSSLLFS